MKQYAYSLILLFAFFGAGVAQAETKLECPAVSIVSPSGIVAPGEIAIFIAAVDSKGLTISPQFRWSVRGGRILDGQETATIRLRRGDTDRTTADVVVGGLPVGCTNLFSETYSCACHDPGPVKLDQFSVHNKGEVDGRLKEISRILEENPNDQGYLFFSYPDKVTSKEMAAKESRFTSRILQAKNIDVLRLTKVRMRGGFELVQIWRVPPGAENPLCYECENGPSECPSITITGPTGIVPPGEPYEFTAKLVGELPKNKRYLWSVSKGQILEGQGTLRIRVYHVEDNAENLTATIKVVGLLRNCTNTAAAIVPPTDLPESASPDQFQ